MCFLILFLSTFLTACGYGTMLALPMFVMSLGGSEELAGVLLGISGVGTISAVLLCKYLLRHFHGKYIVLVGGLVLTLGLGMLSEVRHFSILIGLAVILTGAGWGCVFNAIPYMLSLLTNNHNRSMFFNYFSATIVLGSGLGPILIHEAFPGVILFSLVFKVACGCMILAMLVLSCLCPTQIIDTTPALKHAQKSWIRVMKSPVFYPIAMTFLGACVYSMMNYYQMTYAHRLGLDYAYFYIAYCSAVVLSRLLLGKFLAEFCQFHLAVVLSVMVIFSLWIFMWASHAPWIYFTASAFLGVSYGLLYPAVQAMSINLADPGDRKDVISYFSLAYFIATFAFPVLGGAIIVHFGYRGLLWSLIIVMVLELILAVMLKRKIRALC